jgi:hypothetical protein
LSSAGISRIWLNTTGAADCATAGSLLARCKACGPDANDPKQPKAAGPLVSLLVQLITTFLTNLLKNQQA